MKEPRKAYYIIFEDHYSDNFDWVDLDALSKPSPTILHAIGFLLEETKEMYQLCLLTDEDIKHGQIAGVMNILKSTVREVYEIDFKYTCNK